MKPDLYHRNFPWDLPQSFRENESLKKSNTCRTMSRKQMLLLEIFGDMTLTHLGDSEICENLRKFSNRAHPWGSGNLLENVEVAQFPGTEGCRMLQVLSCTVSILIFQFKWTLDLRRICSTWASQYNDTGADVIHHPAVSNHQNTLKQHVQVMDVHSSLSIFIEVNFQSWLVKINTPSNTRRSLLAGEAPRPSCPSQHRT